MKIWLWTMDRQNYGSNQNTTKYIEYYQKNTNLKKKKKMKMTARQVRVRKNN